MLNCSAFYSVIAWRVMYVCQLGRQCPEMDGEVIFEPSDWESVYSILGLPVPAEGCPSLNDVVRAIARLGGFIDRPKNDTGTKHCRHSAECASRWPAPSPDSRLFSAQKLPAPQGRFDVMIMLFVRLAV